MSPDRDLMVSTSARRCAGPIKDLADGDGLFDWSHSQAERGVLRSVIVITREGEEGPQLYSCLLRLRGHTDSRCQRP